MIGEIRDVKVDEDCLGADGRSPDIEKILPLVFDYGSRSYYGIGRKVAQAWNVGKPLMKNG